MNGRVSGEGYRSEHRTTGREVIVGWIVLGLIALVIVGVIVMTVRRRRAMQARLVTQPDSWKVARDASIGEASAQAKGMPPRNIGSPF
jgi:hypothetical protein